MQDRPVEFTFQETMEGGFALGEDDPRTGVKKGNAEGSNLSMHATVTIRDLMAFIDDPQHLGELAGRIDFTPFGEDIPAPSGVFNLFFPSDDPRLKYMVYELAFEHENEAYYLAGKKEVKDDPGFDLWSDTTTLYTKVHKGTDTSGPVVGAGVLSLSVKELINLVTTMQVPNATSIDEKIRAVAAFGRFFLGDLWDTYGRRLLE